MKSPGLLLLSFIIAALLSLYVRSEINTTQRALFVPVEIINLPPEKMILQSNQQDIRVTVRGPSYLISRISAAPPTFKIQAPENVETHFSVTLQTDMLLLPRPVQVVGIEPSNLEFIVDNRMEREIPVEVLLLGELSTSFELKSLQAIPDVVHVVGPETEVKSLTKVKTAEIDLRNITTDIEREVTLRRPGRYTTMKEGSVRVKIGLRSLQQTREFKALPIEVRSRDGKPYAVEPEQVTISVIGPKEKIAKLEAKEIVPFIAATNGGGSVKVEFNLPADISLASVNPGTVNLIEIAPKSSGEATPSKAKEDGK